MPKPGGTPQQRLEGAGPGAPAHTLPPASLPGRAVSPPALLLAVFIDVPAAAHLSRAYGLKKFGHEALGQQRMQGFAAYQLRTAFLRTNQKTMVLL